MSLKRDENNKIVKINFFTFKKFIKLKKPLLHKKKFSKDLKIILIFSMVFITLKTNKPFKKLDKDFLFDIFVLIFKNDKKINKEFTVDLLVEKTKYFDFVNRISSLDVNSFYESIFSFYNYSGILNYLKRKKKLKKMIINNDGYTNFVNLNKNLKNILSFIKISSPNRFNYIYRKLIYLV